MHSAAAVYRVTLQYRESVVVAGMLSVWAAPAIRRGSVSPHTLDTLTHRSMCAYYHWQMVSCFVHFTYVWYSPSGR